MKKLLILVVLVAALGYGGATWMLHSKVGDSMDSLVLLAAPFAKIEYGGIRSTLGGELTIENVTIDFNDFSDDLEIGRVGIDTEHFLALLEMNDFLSMQSREVPDYFGFIVDDVRLPSDADYFLAAFRALEEAAGEAYPDDPAARCSGQAGLSPELLAELGYAEQRFSMRMGFERADRGVSVNIDTRVEDMWDAHIDLDIAGDVSPQALMAQAYRPRMSSMRLEYTDLSFNERVRQNCIRQGLSEEEILTAQLDAFRQFGMDNGIEFDEYVIEPYMEFLKGKDTLVITATPNEPVALSQIDLYKPSDVPALLQLEASTY